MCVFTKYEIYRIFTKKYSYFKIKNLILDQRYKEICILNYGEANFDEKI
jgi:hypothetical protein